MRVRIPLPLPVLYTHHWSHLTSASPMTPVNVMSTPLPTITFTKYNNSSFKGDMQRYITKFMKSSF